MNTDKQTAGLEHDQLNTKYIRNLCLMQLFSMGYG